MLKNTDRLQWFAAGEAGAAEGQSDAGENTFRTADGENTAENEVSLTDTPPDTQTDLPDTAPKENVPEHKAAEEASLPKVNDAFLQLEKQLRQKLRTAKNRQTIAGWERDAEKMKSLYPNFSLPGEMMNNPRFADLVKAGVDVRSAYEVANLKEILSSAMRYASLTAGQKTAQTIAKQGLRPRENSVLDRASSVRHTDVKSLTEKDIRQILSQVSRGAKISFR